MLYRAFLRTLSKWPEDKLRPTRDFKHVLEQRVAQARVEGMDEGEAVRQWQALERMVNNDFKTRYPLSDKMLQPAGNPNYYSRLMTTLEQQVQQTGQVSGGGFLSRLFGRG